MAQLPSREGFAEDAPQRPAWRGRTCVRPPPGTRAPPPAHACSLRRGAGRWRRPGGAPRSARALRIVPWAHLCPAVSQAVRAVGGRAQPLRDNYMYLVIEEHTREAVAVDVAVPKRLLEIVGREGVSLTTVLTTHHHWDHARGNAELARLRPGLAVLGADERICALTRRLVHGEELQFGAIHVRCLLTPGHTSGHMSYFLWEEDCPDPPAVFSGDALSVGGCGLRLESTAQQMYQSLVETLGTLPPETKVFCGHEHTLGNLEFAQKVEPGNDHVRAKLSWAKRRACVQVHGEGGPGRGPGGTLQGAGKLRAGS
ncbi:hydroxyacylglutathione hydrolase-like protein isoform X4 [Panthera pardus]|uniref:Hydroxyacylglutathione hydrolase-like protein isoform X4 n=1 Tax=Panthera pardus TaxID=9691 RepID=A0A9V1F0E1_PANPR|nr:hydroxyacylglutathione hydrolase-like protein isoform X4 [Panthera pardus]XP_058567782.1 hydroxyacylglutathione hydrolase-like protein isoform X3 [Neofelis nebulosa]XP_060503976.1 hydroxyacylglutathione hydrolase-like protein isoform X3 [Panthera onca]